MKQSLALVPPLSPEAVRVKKPNRRPGSCPLPSKVTQLRTRQIAPYSERAVSTGDALVASDPEFAAELAGVIRLALLGVPS